MDDILQTIGALMSDPQAKQKLTDIAGSLGLGDMLGTAQSTSTADSPPALPPTDSSANAAANIAGVMNMISKKDPRINLLNAMRPFLSDKRASAIDNISRVMQMSAIAGSMGLFGNQS